MSLADLSDALRENSHIFLAILIGSIVGRLVAQRRLDASQLRKRLGSGIGKYSAISAASLDSALERAAWVDRPVFRFSLSVCVTSVWMGAAFIATEIFDHSFPDSPIWCSPLIAGGVAGALAFVTMRIERHVFLRRLEHLQIGIAEQVVPPNGP
jgi:hypothetical protein